MRIVVSVFCALSLHPAPGSRNLCPGAIIFDRPFRRNPRVAGSAVFYAHPLHPFTASRPLNPRPGPAAP